MKKNILLTVLFLIFVNQNAFAAKAAAATAPMPPVTTAAELFEIMTKASNSEHCDKCLPLNELASFMTKATSKNRGMMTPSILSVIKVYLEREGKNDINPFKTFYNELSIYLNQTYPFDVANFGNPICNGCHKNNTNPVTLSCDHIFCYDCLFNWYEGDGLKEDDAQIKCPLCGTRFDDSVLALLKSGANYNKETEDAAIEAVLAEIREIVGNAFL